MSDFVETFYGICAFAWAIVVNIVNDFRSAAWFVTFGWIGWIISSFSHYTFRSQTVLDKMRKNYKVCHIYDPRFDRQRIDNTILVPKIPGVIACMLWIPLLIFDTILPPISLEFWLIGLVERLVWFPRRWRAGIFYSAYSYEMAELYKEVGHRYSDWLNLLPEEQLVIEDGSEAYAIRNAHNHN